MDTQTMTSPIGVCVLPPPPPNSPRTVSYGHYIHEILGHAGLCYATVESDDLAECLPQLKILVTVGETAWPEETQNAVQSWVQDGGAWLAIGGVAGMPEIFGVEYRKSEYAGAAWGGISSMMGEGYLQLLDAAHPALSGIPLPQHFFNGVAVTVKKVEQGGELAKSLDSHQRQSTATAVVERQVGSGRCFLIAPDAIGTIVRIQQGVAITRDGVPAPDGTGAVTDGVCKCDDGAVLDWHFDRQDVPGVPGLKGFLEPIADHWRGLILRSIFHLASEQNVPISLHWLYPRNLPAHAHMSHDSDCNVPELAKALLEVTAQAEVSTTWCVILPGYDAEIIDSIKAHGHELSVHYDALDHPWSEVEFDAQWQALCLQFGEKPVSNKNHYTRWEGDTEFFEWCAKRGIEIDETKGPSKFGEAGFVFGSCHPYFPLAPDGSAIDVLELPLHTQDLEIFVPAAIAPAFISGALRVHGVMHLLYHPSHIQRDGVAQSLFDSVAAARAAGMEWWTARQINAWERARRQVTLTADSSGALAVRSAQAVQDATVLVLNTKPGQVSVNGEDKKGTATARWGFDFTAVTFDMEPDTEYRLEVG